MVACLFPKETTIHLQRPLLPAERKLGLTTKRVVTVNCGKCVNCLKKRQNNLAVRSMREASKRGSMHFLTLTYDDTYLPLQVRLDCINKETGEVFNDYPSFPLVRYKGFVDDEVSKEYVSFVRNELKFIRPGKTARVITRPFFETDELFYRFEITPSLCRRDVRLWLKRCRVRYQRERGVSLPDFTYVVCGEYGPNTCRPHYHIAFFGLTYDIVSWFACQWEYGFTNLKSVNAVNEDGSNGFEIASRYIGKYMTKGKFECDSVKCGLSEKPRLMASRGLGVEIDEQLVSYFRCYDLFGKYDIRTCRKEDGSIMTDNDFLRLYDLVSKRSYFTFGDRRYALPRSIIIKLWYCYDEAKKSFFASPLRVKMLSLVSSNLYRNFTEMLRQCHPDISSRAFVLRCTEFLFSSENSSILQDAFGEQSLSAFYARSVF